MKKKIFKIISIALVLCLVLATFAACGGAKDKKAAATDPAAEKQTITLKSAAVIWLTAWRTP